MTPDTPFEVDFKISIPAKLRSSLNLLLRGTERIVIAEKISDNKAPVVNSLRLTTRPGQMPREPLDEICEAIVAIMHIQWRAQETEDPEIGLPPVEFLITCEHYEDRGGKQKRVREQFTYVYKGDVDPSDEVEETVTLEERIMMRVLDTLERQNNALADHNGLLHSTLLTLIDKQSQSLSAQGAASAEVMKHGIPMFFGGMQALLNARTLEFSEAKAKAAEEARTQRIVGSLAALAPYIGTAAMQFIAHKFGIDPAALQSMMGGGAPGGAPPAAAPPRNGVPSNGHVHEPTHEPEAADDEAPRDLVAFAAQQLGNLLTNAQRRTIGREFTKAQQALLDDLFCAETDQEALAAYALVVQKAGPQLIALQRMLSNEQQEALGFFFHAVQAAQQPAPPAE